jgi:hypothetical protein
LYILLAPAQIPPPGGLYRPPSMGCTEPWAQLGHNLGGGGGGD